MVINLVVFDYAVSLDYGGVLGIGEYLGGRDLQQIFDIYRFNIFIVIFGSFRYSYLSLS